MDISQNMGLAPSSHLLQSDEHTTAWCLDGQDIGESVGGCYSLPDKRVTFGTRVLAV